MAAVIVLANHLTLAFHFRGFSFGLQPAIGNFFNSTPASSFLLQNAEGITNRIWNFLTHKFTIGNLEGSVMTLIGGLLIFAVALLMSRTLSALLQKRIAKRAYLDPGLRYTLGRLTQYVIVGLGGLLALRTGFNLDLTSIALLFTALSVGIGF